MSERAERVEATNREAVRGLAEKCNRLEAEIDRLREERERLREKVQLAEDNFRRIDRLIYSRVTGHCKHCDADLPRAHRPDCPAIFHGHGLSYLHRALTDSEEGEHE